MTRPHRPGGPSHISECLAALFDEIEAGWTGRAKGRVAHAEGPGSAAGGSGRVSHDRDEFNTATSRNVIGGSA